MAELDTDAIRRLAALLEELGLSEIEYAKGDERLRVARAVAGTVATVPAGPASAAPSSAAAPAAAPAAPDHPGAIKSPMVGTVYLSPEPGAPAFIKAGDTVAEGQTLVLIEAMKTYNPVRAPRAGKVTRILVSDGMPVEYGEPLLILE
jgi:acetyl-CoA carboxylase biotin carboxyl carrier protein